MFINIYIYSKNKVSLNNYLNFLKKTFNNNKLKLKTVFILFQKKKNKQIFTVLKSPHENKTAQTQFEFKIYKKQLTMYTSKPLKLLYFVKYFTEQNFSDIKIKISINSNKVLLLNILNYVQKNLSKKLVFKTVSFLKYLDIMGELKFKQILFR